MFFLFCIYRLTKNRGLTGVEITPVNGDSAAETNSLIADLASRKASKPGGSKLESALDKLGMNKRKLSEGTSEDKTKKKKRLDDIMLGLGAAKGVTLDKEDQAANSGGQSLLKKGDGASMSRIPDLNKLQDLLGRPDSPSEAKVQKWLEATMGVVPDRPVTPSTSNSTATSSSGLGKSPKNVGNLMEWMSSLSGDEHVTVLNRFTGKKLSGTQGPKLKYLAQWLIENPMFDVDPKWAEIAKNKEALKAGTDLNALKRKGPGRPPMDEPAAKKAAAGGIGPSYLTSGLSTMAGLDPKNPMSALASLDPKNPMSLAALYGLDPKKLDPVTAAVLGFGDPKNPLKMDPMMMAAMGMDSKTLQAMGLDAKSLAALGIDPKMLDASAKNSMMGLDPKMLQSMGLDAKSLQTLGIDPKMLSSMGMAGLGLDAKTMQAMGLDISKAPSAGSPASSSAAAAAAGGLDPKMLAAMGMDEKTLQAMGLDPKILQSMGMDPKILQSMGMDPKTLAALGMAPGADLTGKKSSTSSPSGKSTPTTISSKAADAANMDAIAKAMGLDPKKVDPAMMAALGLDPKKMDPLTMAMLDPKNPNNSAMMAAMAAMDPNMAAMYGYGLNPAMMSGIPGMDMLFGGTGKSGKSNSSANTNANPSSKASVTASSPRASPRPPSRASAKSDDRRSPRTSVPSSVAPRTSTPSSSASLSSAAAALGLDPKILASMDPSLLKAAGLGGFGDPKNAAKMDPMMMAAMGDPKALQAMGLDPKSLAALGIDPKSLASMDPKMMGFDPKALAGMDPKLLQAAGIVSFDHLFLPQLH